MRRRPKHITRNTSWCPTSATVSTRGPLQLHPPHLLPPRRLLQRLPARPPLRLLPLMPRLQCRPLACLTIPGTSHRPPCPLRRSRLRSTRGPSHSSSHRKMTRGPSLSRLRNPVATRGIIRSLRLRLPRLRRPMAILGPSRNPSHRCRQFRLTIRGTNHNLLRNRRLATTPGISRNLNLLPQRLRLTTLGISRNPLSRRQMPTHGTGPSSRSRNHKSRPRTTNTR